MKDNISTNFVVSKQAEASHTINFLVRYFETIFSPILNLLFFLVANISVFQMTNFFSRGIYGVVYYRNHKFFHFISIFLSFLTFLSLRIISVQLEFPAWCWKWVDIVKNGKEMNNEMAVVAREKSEKFSIKRDLIE